MRVISLKGAQLSPQQLRLWRFIQDKTAYHAQCAIEVRGDLEVAVFRQALQYVVDRHEILRTTFVSVPTMELPMQAIGEQSEISCPFIDLQQLSAVARQACQEECWYEIMHRPFDLENGPLLHVEVLCLAPQSYLLLLSLPTLCADSLTLKQLSTSILQAYSAYWQNAEEPEEEEPLQYVDVVAWLQELQEEADEQTSHWRKQALSQIGHIALPFEKSAESIKRQLNGLVPYTFESEQIIVPLQTELQYSLQTFTQRFTVSTEIILLTVWQLLLWRLTNKQDVLIGMLCDGRPYEELAHIIGPYAHAVPVGISLTEDCSFLDALQLMQRAHQQSLEKQAFFTWESSLIDEREQPYFPISFAYESWPERVVHGPLTASLQRLEYLLETFELQLCSQEFGASVQLQFTYNASVFSKQQIQQLAALFTQLLKTAAEQPEAPVGTLQLLSLEQQEQRRASWRGPQQDWPFQPLHRLFEAQVQRQPAAPALRAGALVLSYAQVEQDANRLAHLLRQQGVQPGARVALCLPRDQWAIISLLAVLKAGACYVPLDPEQPVARLTRLAQDAAVSLLVCRQQQATAFASLMVPLLLVETLPEDLAGQPSTPPLVEVGAEDLAYIMYTSGSTGTPKGVMIRHQSVSNYTQALCQRLQLQAGWQVATVSSLAADLGNTAIFGGLSSGDCVHVLSSALVTDAQALSHYVQHTPLDVLKIVPSHLAALLQAGVQGLLPRQCLILGGEALSWALLEQVQQARPTCRLYNHYGPTETTIGVLVHDLGPVEQLVLPAPEQRTSSVPLGRPLANTQLFVLDAFQQWVPPGVVGELSIAGAGLAAGYLGQPEQTQASFVSLEAGGPSERAYRTGDRVCETEQGELVFVGRRDEQVKLRGYRIEVAEVEAQLRRVEGVREAVVLLGETQAGEACLVAYLVAWRHPRPSTQQIGEALREQVPEYLVPGQIVWIDQLPFNATGKIDRQRLARLPLVDPEASGALEAARTPIEDVMMGIWQQVLQLPALGRSENFFRLGGHSLLGTRLIARLRAVFGVEVPINWLFEAPTVGQLSQRIAEALRGRGQAVLPEIVPVSRAEALPLSFGQQRLWFLDQLEPGQATYNVPLAVWVRGPLQAGALQWSLQQIVGRHEVLRTTFEARAGQPVQIIHAAGQWEMVWIDLSALEIEQGRQQAQQLASQEAQRPFDLQRGPMLRGYLGRLSRQEHALLLTMHHCVSDAWSREVLIGEVMQHYRAYSQGEGSPLPALPVQYADYAFWQRQRLQGEVLQEQLDYWQQQLADLTPLELPLDYPRPPIQSFRGASYHFMLPASIALALRHLSQEQGTTLFMTLLAAFQVLLARYSGQGDIAVGTPIANRRSQDLEELIGFFVNTLVLRADLSDNPTFVELLGRVRSMVLGAYGHQDLPFEQVVEALRPPRDRSRAPLFQVLFVLQPPSTAPDIEIAVQTEGFVAEQPISKFELSMIVGENEQGLSVTLEYNTDLFARASIQRLSSHWQHLLEAIVAEPSQRLSALCLLSADERQSLLFDWNHTQEDYGSPVGLHELVEAQVKRTPQAIALLFEEQQMSYGLLNARANQLARHLQARGVGPEVFVGVCLYRSLDLIVALLAILKAGGVYVPLDPSYPQEQRTYLLQDAQVRMVLTRQSVYEQTSLPADLAVFCLDSDWPMLAGVAGDDLGNALSVDQLAYMIYTSGSTGRPKGAMNTHQGIVNRLLWIQDRFPLTQDDRVLQKTPYSFDVSVWEFFWPLLAGAQLVVAEPEGHRDPVYLQRLMEERAVTTLHFVPSMLQVFLQQAQRGVCPQVRQVFCSGEALNVELQERFFALWPHGVRLHNLYGPTEAAIEVTWWECQPERVDGTVPIGYPIANTQLYILDGQGQPVPVGVVGELFIGGVSVARGYWRRPDLTAERFVPDPFGQREGVRLYRTGDRVRYREDGRIEFLGRADEQVKLRGYRIELGEIEAVIRQHPAVRAIAMGVQTVEIADKRLIAYVELHEGQSLSLGELRQYVGERLLEYMRPAAMVEMEQLPLSASGKVNRKLLPAPPSVVADSARLGEAVRDELEGLVLQCWRQVLGRERLGVHDNFFEVGGHSLLATQVVARLRVQTGVEVPVRKLFESPTVAQLTSYVRQELRHGQEQEMPAIVAVPRTQELPLSFAQQRLWFLHQLEPDNIAYNIPDAVRLHGQLDRNILQHSLRAVIQRHESLRTTFPQHGEEEAVQRIAPEPNVHLALFNLRDLALQEREQQVRRLVQQEAEQPFNLMQGPLFRCWLLQLDEQDQVLLLTMHHIIFDGWSMSILMRELITLYAALQQGEDVKLPDLPVQYADYAHWQRQWLQGAVLQEQLDYWKQQLAGLHPLELPTDHPRPTTQTFQGAWHPLRLSRELRQLLHALSQREGVTLFMTLLAAFQVLLAYYSGQEDIAVGTPIANRTHEEIEGLIGFFVNTLVLRTDLSGNPTFVEVLRKVREVALGAYAHQDLPFEQVVEVMQPERNLSRNPLFQVTFRVDTISSQHSLEETIGYSGLTSRPLGDESTTIKFDLTLVVVDTEQGLGGALGYNTNLFEAATIERLVGHFQTLLECIATYPEQHLSQYSIVTRTQQQQILEEWNATETAFAGPFSLHHLFEAQVERSPDAIALTFEQEQVTYRCLNTHANQLAHHLQSLGVEPDMVVGVCLQRSPTLLIGILAALKAGGAYVPLDPALPADRLAFMLDDARVSILLIQRALMLQMPSYDGYVVYLEHTQSLSQMSGKNPESNVLAEHLAYVMYTSGSTGLPKGVQVTHQAIVNRLLWAQQSCPLNEEDRVVQIASFSFDISLWELLGPLMAGARVILLRPGGQQESSYIVRVLKEQQVTVAHFVPSLLQVLLNDDQLLAQTTLRRVLCGGESLSVELAERFLKNTTVELQQFYGPTEAAISMTSWLCTREAGLRRVPIGRPIANMQSYVLSPETMEPMAVGVAGELYIGGIGLARGYQGQPGLTAERFVPHCFSQLPGARLYRTGDRARYRADGSLEYLGRRDQQVKLRGYRIELGEIESVLDEHPQIKQSVVLLQGEEYDEKRLVAYIVGEEGESTLRNVEIELRASLKKRLPDYMVPSQFVLLPALPLTPYGKVDRRSLHPPVRYDMQQQDRAENLFSPIEELVQQIYQEVLNRQNVGLHENFFEIGGHSLLGMRVITRLGVLMGIDVPVHALFEAPTVMELAAYLRQELRQGHATEMPPIVLVSRAQTIPLSFAQQRLWFLDQLEPGSTTYNILSVVRLIGLLQQTTLDQALERVIQRHESLRTTFPCVQGEPTQHIAPAPTTGIVVLDLRSLPQQEREALARQLAQQEAEQPFDLTQGSLLRCWLLQLGEQDQVLLLTMHHIISDGWSMSILMRELTTLYAALQHGEDAALPDLPVQYVDYTFWQRQWLQGEVLQEQLDYWQQQLAGLSPLELPTDYPRPAIQTFQGARHRFQLPAQLSQQLKQLSLREGVTLFMTLLATFQVLLARYSGQGDIAVGTPIANRRSQDLEELIGFFVNTLVLRADLSDNPTFVELLGRVRSMVLGAYGHQDLPFEQVVEALRPPRDRSRAPLFQVLFVLQPPSTAPDIEIAVQTEGFVAEQHIAKFELSMIVGENEQGLSVTLEYNTDLFARASIQRLSSHWQHLLEAIVAAPSQRLSALCLLSADERQSLLFDWNHTQEDYGSPAGLHELVEAQVKRTPQAIALLFEEQQMSYGLLNARANQLARHLQARGVGPEVFVGVCLYRSLDLVVALLAILKAGGVYVPLDPSYPQEQRTYLLQDAQVRIVLTRQSVHERTPLPADLAVFYLDSDWSALAGVACDDLRNTLSADQLAYMIYTSGSTGRPKGAMNTHQGIVNRLLWMQDRYQLTQDDRVLQKTPYSFDVSVWEFFWPLLAGAQLVVAEPEGHRDPVYLQSLMEERAVTTLHFVPSMLQVFLQQAQRGVCPQVRQVFCSGEALNVELQERFFALWPHGVRLHNLYGPTEAAIDVTWWECQPERVDGTVPIGYPIANTQLYILDGQGQPVPVGVVGELFIGGVSVARGYWRRPDLTAERFVPDPFGQREGVRLYRTGDRVRYWEDGRIEFLGRTDEQVKLRGYRIELGEIEAVLSQHPQVKQCVILLQGEEPVGKQLIAYVVIEEGASRVSSREEELRRFLKDQLPDYMLPAHFVILAALPLTPNGKVDRRSLSLPALHETRQHEQIGARNLFNPVEELVQQVYQEVLKRDTIGLHENFFEIGGHSLLATQVTARLRGLLGRVVPLRLLFEAPTINELAARLQQTAQLSQDLEIPPILPVARTQDLPLSFAQQRLWFLHQLDPDSTAYTIFDAIRMLGSLNKGALYQSFVALVQRHESLRTTFEEHDGQPTQRIEQRADFFLPCIDLRDCEYLQRETLMQSLLQQARARPFNLSEGPLCRVALLQLDEQEYILLLSMHHIISDGWSMDILVRELGSLYQAYVAGEPSPLAPLPIQYADYALWQRQWLQGEVLQQQMRYWTRQLSEARALEVPGDYPRPHVLSHRGDRHSFHLDFELTQALELLSRQEGVTPFMLLLASWQVLLSSLSGQEDIVVGTDSANRSYLETEGLIGFFVNLLALRIKLSSKISFRELLQQVREMVLEAYTYQELPFEMIVEHLRLERDGKRTPLVNVLFVMQNVPSTEVELSNLLMKPVENNMTSAKFDLALFVTERAHGLYGSVNYSLDLFTRETIVTLMQRYEALLRSIVAQPDTQITALEIATAEEKTQQQQAHSLLRQQLKARRGQPIHPPASSEPSER